MTVRLLPAAIRDIRETAESLRKGAGMATALRFADSIDETISLLRLQPMLGRSWDKGTREGHGFRITTLSNPFRHWLLIYRIDPAGLVIVRIVHGAQDPGRQLPG